MDNGDIGNNRGTFSQSATGTLGCPIPPRPYPGQVPESPALSTEPAYLAGLNPPQREAVLTTEGPVLVLAGAGTGKTAALTARLAHLIATRLRLAEPDPRGHLHQQGRARNEGAGLGGSAAGRSKGMPWLGTFHSVAARMLRSHAELVGLQSNFTILDTDDQLRVLKQLIAAANLDEKRWPARQLAALIDRWKNRGWTPARSTPANPKPSPPAAAPISMRQYQERLRP